MILSFLWFTQRTVKSVSTFTSRDMQSKHEACGISDQFVKREAFIPPLVAYYLAPISVVLATVRSQVATVLEFYFAQRMLWVLDLALRLIPSVRVQSWGKAINSYVLVRK